MRTAPLAALGGASCDRFSPQRGQVPSRATSNEGAEQGAPRQPPREVRTHCLCDLGQDATAVSQPRFPHLQGSKTAACLGEPEA